MKLKLLTGAAVAAALLMSAPAQAERPPSRHLRCDGMPDNVTAGETAARLLGAVTLLGIFAPSQEGADASARLQGAEGVAICEEALAAESNEVRRAELILATAIHHVEAGQHEQAIAAARRALTDRSALAATPAFRRSLNLFALDIQATALVELGRTDEAVARGVEMAVAAPYDIVNILRASYYVDYSTHWGQPETAFYDHLVKLYPSGLLQRARARELNGDVANALADYDLYIRMYDDQLGGVPEALRYRVALSHALSGNFARAEELVRQAEAPPPGATGKGGEADAAQPPSEPPAPEAPEPASPATVEMNDLYRVWQAVHAGDLPRARTLYLARSRWIYVDAALRARLVARLREGAPAEQLTGALAQTPEQIVAAWRAERRTNALAGKGPGNFLFGRRQPYFGPEIFARYSRDVWRMERSRIIDFPQDQEGPYRVYAARQLGGGTPSGYALLLHAALLARNQGQNAFSLHPSRGDLTQLSVRFGNRGGEGMIDSLTFDADQVIADLAPVIPQPVSR